LGSARKREEGGLLRGGRREVVLGSEAGRRRNKKKKMMVVEVASEQKKEEDDGVEGGDCGVLCAGTEQEEGSNGWRMICGWNNLEGGRVLKYFHVWSLVFMKHVKWSLSFIILILSFEFDNYGPSS
jgi:hypothetical protein